MLKNFIHSFEFNLFFSNDKVSNREEYFNNKLIKNSIKLNLFLKVLNQYCHENIDQSKILFNECGKPFLKGNKIFFNKSCRNNKMLIVVSNSAVGCDIEALETTVSFSDKSIFSCEELALSGNDSLSIWTMKEALGKFIGTGIIGDLAKYNFIDRDGSIKKSIIYNGDQLYFLRYLNEQRGYMTCICTAENIESGKVDISFKYKDIYLDSTIK